MKNKITNSLFEAAKSVMGDINTKNADKLKKHH
jgi:hypothetical protein